MIDIRDRVHNKYLHAKIVSPEEAAAIIKPGMNIGVSGFTGAGYPKAVPMALAKKMEKEPFKINLWTGASVGKELDDALIKVNGIHKRMPWQNSPMVRDALNSGQIEYFDPHLSNAAQLSRSGILDGSVDIAIVEACAITEEGHIIPTTSEGSTASYLQSANIVIVEVNITQPLELEGMHDVYVPLDPPNRQPIPLIKGNDRIGTTYIPCGLDKIKYIVPCDLGDTVRPFAPIDRDSQTMSEHIIEFFKHEIKVGRLPKNLLPLQSGVGSVANAVIGGFVNSDFEDLEVFTEVIQDGMFDLIDSGKLKYASGTSFSLSPDGLARLYKNLGVYREKVILRPVEIANNPEVVRRLGLIAMNTAIEVDIFGHVNSTHISGSRMMNGIGGAGDFARCGYLTCFFCRSTVKNGAISTIVPMCSHIDHTEHDTAIFVTERGLADVRGLSPRERARVIINNCAHPDYKPMLFDYLERAEKATKMAHTPHLLNEALSWHLRFMETGTMRK
jgi:succinyl-CoA:acetate CoA-transferase